MINLKSLEEVDKSTYKEFVIPLYESYCFSNIFGTIKYLFHIPSTKRLPPDTLEELNIFPNKVVFLLVDAFGWYFYEQNKKVSNFLCEVEKNGVVSKLTSQFPSTTTAHVITALTGETVCDHGINEWYYYEPVVDDIITAFLFKEARKSGIETLKSKNINPANFLPQTNFFKELSDNGIKVTAYQPSFINEGTFANAMYKDAVLKGYQEYEDLFESLTKDLVKSNDKEYFYVYLPEIDTVAHEKGDSSADFRRAVERFLTQLDVFYEKGKNTFKDTLIMISADHGQVEVDLNKKNYLNEMLPNIEKYLKKNKSNNLICPTGYCRDLFLHVKDESINEAKDILERELKDICEVYTFEQLKELGFFPCPSKRLTERCGNLILLPKGNNQIWWYEKDVFELIHRGVHGGASKKEMEIPLLTYMF